jgi:hypothetical protein
MLESFDEWVHEAEEKLLAPGDYPLVDSSEIDMADELQRIAGHTVREDFEDVAIGRVAVMPLHAFSEARCVVNLTNHQWAERPRRQAAFGGHHDR